MNKTACVITTINSPNSGMNQLFEYARDTNNDLIVVADKKTPEKWINHCTEFLSVPNQEASDFTISRLLPWNHYARKNLGYLVSMQKKTEWIYETDDDNIPLSNPFNFGHFNKFIDSVMNETGKWVNIYTEFNPINLPNEEKLTIWPRGLPLEEIYKKNQKIEIEAPHLLLWQGLANGDPDVDAIFRLIHPDKTEIKFEPNKNIVLNNKNWSPFNSQTTWWNKALFPLMYLPATCTFRVTDILRSYITLRILRELKTSIGFTSPVVYQNRNEHNLIKDFESETQLYILGNKYIDRLESLKFVENQTIGEMLFKCYEVAESIGLTSKKEYDILSGWLSDLKQLGYISAMSRKL
jgi:hypothetical protein